MFFFESINRLNLECRGKDDIETTKLSGTYKMKEPQAPCVIIFALVLLACLSVLNSKIFDVYFYSGYGYTISVSLIFLSIIMYIAIRKFSISIKMFRDIVFMLVTILYIFASASIMNSGYRYIGVVLNTMGTVFVVKYCALSENMVKFIFGLMMVATLICIPGVSGYYGSQFENDAVNSNYLAFFGVVIMVYGNYFLTYMRKVENYKIQAVRILLCLVSFYIIWECQSRGSLLAWVFYVVCVYVIPAKVFINKKMGTFITIVIAAFGVAFSYLYVNVIGSFFSTFMGKSTATRYRLWSFFWNSIVSSNKNLILGFGTHSELREKFGYGLHNIYIGIWYDIGLIGLLLFMAYIVWNIRRIYEENKQGITILQMYALVGFFSFMISDYFAITFTGPLVIWNYAILGLCFKRGTSIDWERGN